MWLRWGDRARAGFTLLVAINLATPFSFGARQDELTLERCREPVVMRILPRSTRTHQQGFTLIEVTIALGIMSMVLVATAQSRIVIRYNSLTTVETLQATTLLQSAMDRVLGADLDAHLSLDGELAHGAILELPGATTLEQPEIMLATPGYTPGDPQPESLRVSLRLSWVSHRGRLRTESLTTSRR